MDQARATAAAPPPREETDRPCSRELLAAALEGPWGMQARFEELLDRIERRAPR